MKLRSSVGITLPAGSLGWWGNIVSKTTADGRGTPYLELPARILYIKNKRCKVHPRNSDYGNIWR
jgi:hypothetical protein